MLLCHWGGVSLNKVVCHFPLQFTLVPYAVTPNFQRWAAQLSEFGVSVFGESLEWIQQYGHKVSFRSTV